MDRITNVTDEQIKLLCEDDKMFTSSSFSKLYIYNGYISYPLQKYWFTLTDVKIIDIGNSDLKFVISEKNTNHSKFLSYIDKLDKKIYELLITMYPSLNKEQPSYVRNKNFPPIFTMNRLNSNIFDDNGKQSNSKILKIDHDLTVSVFFELSDVTIWPSVYKNHYNIKQIKTKCNKINTSIFDDKNTIIDSPILSNKLPPSNTIVNCDPVPNIPKPLIPKQTLGKTKQPPFMQFCVTPDALNEQIQKIKDKKNQSEPDLFEIDMKKNITNMLSELNNRNHINKKLDEEFRKIILE